MESAQPPRGPVPPALTDTHRHLLAHAAKVTAYEGWFPEFDFNGRMKRPLDTLVTRGMLERREVNRSGMVRDSWPPLGTASRGPRGLMSHSRPRWG